jgi:beta-phosphoglucomutase-like phosphatase (HAD superfamily)
MDTIDAILFDMDGVLMDSEPLHLRATQFALGERARYTERDNQSFFGVTDTEMFRILRILFNVDASTDDLVRKKRDCLVGLVRAEGRGLPGVPEIPLRFREAGFRLGLVSASARPIIDTILETVGLRRAFETIVSGDEVARGKPAPDGYLMAARRLAVGPERCFVVEDTRNGVLAAKAAGMTVAAVPSSASSDEDFSPADLVLPSLEALPKVLERNGNGNGHSHSSAGVPPARERG